jgi:hypothetical protein
LLFNADDAEVEMHLPLHVLGHWQCVLASDEANPSPVPLPAGSSVMLVGHCARVYRHLPDDELA